MSMWLSNVFKLLVLLPAALLCYIPMHHHLKLSPIRILILCLSCFALYIPAVAWISATLHMNMNIIFYASLLLFFAVYYKTLDCDFSRSLSVFINVCAIMSFPSTLAYVFDSRLHPTYNFQSFSAAAALFQFIISIVFVAIMAFPFYKYYAWLIDNLAFPKLWYVTLLFPIIITFSNVAMIPHSYQTLYVNRIFTIYCVMETFLIFFLLFFYAMFYYTSVVLVEQSRLEEQNRFLDMQANQYHSLQNRMQETSRLRHDFRHSVHALTQMADEGDLEHLRSFLHDYEASLNVSHMVRFCENSSLNALFNHYYELTRLSDIKTNWRITLPEPLSISEVDILSLLGNILENAIFGCQTAPENERTFELNIEVKHSNCLYIVSTNSFNGKVNRNANGYVSTKGHGKGIGLYSIQTIAKKYNGICRISHSGTEFFVDVMLRV